MAGKPRIKAMRMMPSSPIRVPRGSRKPAMCIRRLSPPTVRLARSQITRPAGAATATARPRTNRVRSKMERTMTFPGWGRR